VTAAAGRARQGTALGLTFAALMGASVGLQAWRDRWYARPPAEETVLYLPSEEVVARLALSYRALVADVYWIRAVQYFGSTRLANREHELYERLYPLLSITTTLDPLFNIAYRFGAIFLSEAPPGGPGRPDLAIELLRKGLIARPDHWRYMQDIGFIHYWWLHDYKTAAAWFGRAAEVPGAPWWMKSVAANTLVLGGERRASRALWTAMQQGGESPWLAAEATRRLRQLDALDAADELTALVARWRASRAGEVPAWEAIVRAGYMRGVPLDPAGTPFAIDPQTGAVSVAPSSPLQPMPAEPRAAAQDAGGHR
jgi:hypothetical protein